MPITTGNYEYTKLELHKEEFDNLIFMGPPPIWHGILHKVYLDIPSNPHMSWKMKVYLIKGDDMR